MYFLTLWVPADGFKHTNNEGFIFKFLLSNIKFSWQLVFIQLEEKANFVVVVVVLICNKYIKETCYCVLSRKQSLETS